MISSKSLVRDNQTRATLTDSFRRQISIIFATVELAALVCRRLACRLAISKQLADLH